MTAGRKPTTWEAAKTVARNINVHQETVRRWCVEERVNAQKTPGDCWRIEVKENGFPVELFDGVPEDGYR